MHYMIIAIMMAVIAVIGMMLQRVFQGPTAVSYTHLDVYKRQPLCIFSASIRWI